MTDEANTNTKRILDKMGGRIKKGIIGIAEDVVEDHPIFSTGILSLDNSLGIGGIMGTKFYEIYGPESSCKSYVLWKTIASVQRAGYEAVLADVERSMDNAETQRWVAAAGVNLKRLIVLRSTAEEMMDALHDACEDKDVGIIGIDSIAWMPLDKQIENSMGKEMMRSVAYLMPNFLKKYTAIARTAACVMINQTRDAMSQYAVDRTPAGRAVKFACAARIQMKPKPLGTKKKDGLIYTGVDANFIPIKNKLASPRKADRFLLRWKGGLDEIDMMYRLGLISGVIRKTGSYLSIETSEWELKANGEKAFKEELKLYPEVWPKIRELILANRDDLVDLGAFTTDEVGSDEDNDSDGE